MILSNNPSIYSSSYLSIIYLSIYLPLYLSIVLFVIYSSISINRHVYMYLSKSFNSFICSMSLFICFYISFRVCLFVNLSSEHLSNFWFIWISTHQTLYLSVHLFLYMSFHLFPNGSICHFAYAEVLDQLFFFPSFSRHQYLLIFHLSNTAWETKFANKIMLKVTMPRPLLSQNDSFPHETYMCLYFLERVLF